MKRFVLLLLLVSGIGAYSSLAQTTVTTTSALKDRITGKWTYLGTEEFGVLTPADSTQKKDWLELTADMKYTRVNGGKSESGTYKVTEATRQVFFTNDATKKTTMYKAKSATGAELILDFQTPDLVHTLYKFKKG